MSDLNPSLSDKGMAHRVAGNKRRHENIDRFAMFVGKSRRTIQRWCKLGYIQGAKQTSGGHWRIPRDPDPKVVIEAINRQGGKTRTTWERRTSDGIVTRVSGALVSLDQKDIDRLDPKDPRFSIFYKDPVSLENLRPSIGELEVYKRGNDPVRWRLWIATRELLSDGQELTIQNLARRLKISRSHLYRITSKKMRDGFRDHSKNEGPQKDEKPCLAKVTKNR